MTSNVTLSVEFPLVDKFPDYHDIDVHAAMLSELFGRKIYGEEVAVCENALYWGVFYLGCKPTKLDIKSMLNAAGYVVEEDDEEDLVDGEEIHTPPRSAWPLR